MMHVSQSVPKLSCKFDRYAKPATIEDLDRWAAESMLKIQEATQSQLNKKIENIPPRFRNKTFADFKIENEGQEKVKKIAMRYVETFQDRLENGTSIVLQDCSRTGTLLSLIMHQALIRAGFNSRYESSLEFIKLLLEIKFKSQSYFDAELKALNQYHFFIIDGITESITKDGKPSEIERKLLCKIINERYENNLCTLVITHRDKKEFINRLGETLYTQLSEKGINLILS